MINKKAARKLCKELPRGAAQSICQRLEAKEIFFTVDYIRKVLNPDNSRYNQDVIEEAISLLKELKELCISTTDQILKI